LPINLAASILPHSVYLPH